MGGFTILNAHGRRAERNHAYRRHVPPRICACVFANVETPVSQYHRFTVCFKTLMYDINITNNQGMGLNDGAWMISRWWWCAIVKLLAELCSCVLESRIFWVLHWILNFDSELCRTAIDSTVYKKYRTMKLNKYKRKFSIYQMTTIIVFHFDFFVELYSFWNCWPLIESK